MPDTGRDIWVWHEGTAEAFLATEYRESQPRVSPDGEWLAFISRQSGRNEIYARPIGQSGEQRWLSHEGGVQPRWRADGKELFYLGREGRIMAADFEATYAGRETARELFRAPIRRSQGTNGDSYAPTSDGERFLVIEEPPEPRPFGYTVLLNWRRALERR